MQVSSRLMRLAAVRQLVPLSRSAIYARVAAGTFPRPVKIGCRAVAWRQADVEAWIASPAEVSR